MARRPLRKDIDALCNERGPEDGVDPRYLRILPEGRDIGRKTLQLCGQVSRTLAEVLAACGDGVLRELEVVQVSPAAGGGRLLVTLQPAVSAAPRDLAVIEGRLARASGLLRSEVASAIHRRKAPDLIFRVLLRADGA